jgi:very-long-chain (3R)-3-hydroxyacyl-CoA dehydratase
MPPKRSPATAAGRKPASGLTRTYLFLYNLLNFTLWATCTIRTALALFANYQQNELRSISSIPTDVFPLLLITQSLAALEILHSLIGVVRAPVTTTAMQVASRFVVVWGIMYAFREGSELYDGVLSKYFPDVPFVRQFTSEGLMGVPGKIQYGDLAFFGCMFAWGITECIRYGFFVLQLGGLEVPGWWQWLRYFPFFPSFSGKSWLTCIGTTPSSSCIPSASPPSAYSCTSRSTMRRNMFMSTTSGS